MDNHLYPLAHSSTLAFSFRRNTEIKLAQILHQCHKPGFLLLKQPHNNAFTSEKPGLFGLLENGARYKLGVIIPFSKTQIKILNQIKLSN
ncbi:hypothetical protein NIES267_35000 [Calothrix parasitica NIES-267]|uniref:Uncharacterized protein n=1 Tax=Calothrix parasitica NIES-267 TaxID=1973488 RepID=A0A1Z4LRX7_9CYAN|nr:hypothetical protein NIES267_35000 [Calothrix parasitica NIES-267]